MFYLFFIYLVDYNIDAKKKVDYNIFQLQQKNIDKIYFTYIILFLNTITNFFTSYFLEIFKKAKNNFQNKHRLIK